MQFIPVGKFRFKWEEDKMSTLKSDQYKLKISNIGRLHRAKISVRPLTVLAGPNNTGKSFFFKSLYSLFDVFLNLNPLLARLRYHLRILLTELRHIEFESDFIMTRNFMGVKKGSLKEPENDSSPPTEDLEKQQAFEISLTKKLKEIRVLLRQLIKSCSSYHTSSANVFNSIKYYPEIEKDLSQVFVLCRSLLSNFETIMDKKHKVFEKNRNEMKKHLNHLERIKNLETDEEIATEIFNPVLKQSLIGNFQISNIKELKNDKSQPASIEIENSGKITIEEDIHTDLSFLKSLFFLKKSSRALYIESPFFWKFRNALDLASRNRSFDSARQSLLTPKYFKDLNLSLLEELSGDPAFPEILKSLQDILKGKIVLDELGGLKFQEESGRSHSLYLTATGIVQMGILGLFIEKKILDKNSVLFIDEPETNLHPAWQVKIMKILFQLVKEGVQVIMATHSIDLMKWLETHLKAHPEDKDLIALNQLDFNDKGLAGTPDPDRDIMEKIRSVKKNLADPFLRLFLRG